VVGQSANVLLELVLLVVHGDNDLQVQHLQAGPRGPGRIGRPPDVYGLSGRGIRRHAAQDGTVSCGSDVIDMNRLCVESRS